MSFESYLERDRRLIILLALGDVYDRCLNEKLLQKTLDQAGHKVSRETLRNDILFLVDQGAVLKKEAFGCLWVAEITVRGEEHLGGRIRIEGIERPQARRR